MSDDQIFGRQIARLRLGPRELIVSRGKRTEFYVVLGHADDRATRFVCGLDEREVDALVAALQEARDYQGRPPGRPQQRRPDIEARAPGEPPAAWARAQASGTAGSGSARPVRAPSGEGGAHE